MIAVIADDLTGAAELGGIGLRHRLVTEISTVVPGKTFAQLLVIAADTRSKEQAAAIADMQLITRQLKRLKPEWIYKKTDSVLRGHVVPELTVHLKVLELQRALLIPANPALGRTIIDGFYFFNDLPVHQSSFSNDPEFPVTSSDIRDMLHSQSVQVKKNTETLPDTGIVVGEARQTEDLLTWAARIQPGTLLAGASGFFSAILDTLKRDGNKQTIAGKQGCPVLYVSGTTFSDSRIRIRSLQGQGGPVSYMPPFPDAAWIESTAQLLLHRGKAIVAFDAAAAGQAPPLQLRVNMAKAIDQLLKKVTVGELIIEGGSTAYAILQQVGLRTFIPEEELAPGVVRLSVPAAPGLHVTVKPGSYHWPESIRF